MVLLPFLRLLFYPYIWLLTLILFLCWCHFYPSVLSFQYVYVLKNPACTYKYSLYLLMCRPDLRCVLSVHHFPGLSVLNYDYYSFIVFWRSYTLTVNAVCLVWFRHVGGIALCDAAYSCSASCSGNRHFLYLPCAGFSVVALIVEHNVDLLSGKCVERNLTRVNECPVVACRPCYSVECCCHSVAHHLNA